MSIQLIPSKRQHDHNEPNVRGKWQKTAAFTSQNLRIPPETTFFRVLCPASKCGNVIGKDGDIISHIGQQTGATVRVEETVPGCDERIIIIVESDVENEGGSNQNKEEEKNTGDEGGSEQNKKEEKNTSDEVDDADKQENEGKDEKSVAAEDSGSEKGPSAAQKALVLVFEKIAEGESETDGGDEENQKPSTFTLRLLVLSSQVGCILGKGGRVIKQMASESGAQIRIIPRDKVPVCASSFNDVVQITGSLDTVRRAFLSVSLQLMELPPRVDESTINTSGLSSHSSGHPLQKPEAYPVRNYPFPSQGPPFAGPRDGENGIPGRMNPSQNILTFRLLCPDEKAGAVIGKGGSIIKALQHESDCEIKVLEGSHSEDRVIIISGPAHPDDRISAPQDAVLRIQTQIVRAAPEGKENTVMAKILISSN